MKLVNLLAAAWVSGAAIGSGLRAMPDPTATRPLAGIIEVRGAHVAWISPGPVTVVGGEPIEVGWVGHAGADGVIRFAVSPTTDYVVMAGVGETEDRLWSSHPMPVTADHEIEAAVRGLLAAELEWRRVCDVHGANFFDLERWRAVILAETRSD